MELFYGYINDSHILQYKFDHFMQKKNEEKRESEKNCVKWKFLSVIQNFKSKTFFFFIYLTINQ